MPSPSFRPPLLFISDIHLGGFSKEENQRIENELIQLIKYCKGNKIQLIILGDLFDYWMAYPGKIPKLGEEVLDELKNYNNSLGPTPFVTGNHDYWTGKYLQRLGLLIHHDELEFSVEESHFFTLHGDGLSDTDYDLPHSVLHRFLQNERFIKVYQNFFPAKIGITLMKYFSRFTRLLDGNKENKAQYLNSWAQQMLKNSSNDIIISGHDHIPREKHFAFGTYINLGTFYQHRTVALYKEKSLSLKIWKPQIQTLQSFENNA